MRLLKLPLGLLLCVCLSPQLYARITPQQVAIVINAQDEDSRLIAEYYRDKRGIPAENLIEISLPANKYSISEDRFNEAYQQLKKRTPASVQYYALAWVYVLPSVTTPTSKELWGLVINEAFNQGVPVITTDAVGAAAGGLVQHNVNGLIIQEKNADALAAALQKIVEEPEHRERLSQNARKSIDNWDNEKMITGFKNAIQFVANKR